MSSSFFFLPENTKISYSFLLVLLLCFVHFKYLSNTKIRKKTKNEFELKKSLAANFLMTAVRVVGLFDNFSHFHVEKHAELQIDRNGTLETNELLWPQVSKTNGWTPKW
jgi:hypothetical protein